MTRAVSCRALSSSNSFCSAGACKLPCKEEMTARWTTSEMTKGERILNNITTNNMHNMTGELDSGGTQSAEPMWFQEKGENTTGASLS